MKSRDERRESARKRRLLWLCTVRVTAPFDAVFYRRRAALLRVWIACWNGLVPLPLLAPSTELKAQIPVGLQTTTRPWHLSLWQQGVRSIVVQHRGAACQHARVPAGSREGGCI